MKNSRSYPKIKEVTCLFSDSNLFEYYDSKDSHLTKSFFIQRIKSSTTFIILFPTGLLLQLACFPLSLQAKLQLNLKKDEKIIDIAYCVDSSETHHCLWLIDN